MADVVWQGPFDLDTLGPRLINWRSSERSDAYVMVCGLSREQATQLAAQLEITSPEIYEGGNGIYGLRVPSESAQSNIALRDKEHQQLLLILQEALIQVAERDTDLASKLAARAYVNLKTDPKGQRRYDGLLHRFTGVLHRRPQGP